MTKPLETYQRGALKQYGGFALLNGSGFNHLQRAGQWRFKHFNIFPFGSITAAARARGRNNCAGIDREASDGSSYSEIWL